MKNIPVSLQGQPDRPTARVELPAVPDVGDSVTLLDEDEREVHFTVRGRYFMVAKKTGTFKRVILTGEWS